MSRRSISLAATLSTFVLVIVGLIRDPSSLYPWGIPLVAALFVGGLLTWRVPSNPVGWLVLIFAATASVGQGFIGTAETAIDVTRAGWFDAVGYAINTAGVLALPAALLRFPNGDRLSPRWRVVEWVAIAAAIGGFTAALLNGGWGGDIAQATAPSPLRDTTAPWGDVMSSVFYPLFTISMFLASVSLIIRYRRSFGEERLKLKWLAYAAGFIAACFLAVVSAGGGSVALNGGWEALLIALAFASIPVAVGMAILQYRLYDIDLVINRTVVLAILAGFITLVYALIVVGLGNLVGGNFDGLVLPIAATAVIAVAFEPVRNVAQRWANRAVYGRKASPYEILADLTERLSHSEGAEGILERLAERLGAGTGAERATIWLGTESTLSPGVSWPQGGDGPESIDLNDEHVFAVTHDDVVVGAFEVVKYRGSALSTAERHLIGDLAGSAGAVLGYQRLNDSLQARAAELAESRTRLVEAQDTERRRLERDLHDGAQQSIVALKVKIGLAGGIAEKQEANDLAELLRDLADEAQAALDEVRSLAKGIYPPVLESDGLASAVSALASGSPVPVEVSRDGIGRYARDVEAAVYFDISEAVTNAVKHAQGPIHVDLAESNGHLEFAVTDSGPGFDPAIAKGGSGLQNMRDRMDAVGGELVVSAGESGGASIRGSVPVAAHSAQADSQARASSLGSKSDFEMNATAPAASARSRNSS